MHTIDDTRMGGLIVAKCPNCGSEIKGGAPFCGQCGVKQAAAASETVVNSHNPVPHDFRNYFFVPAVLSALGDPATFRRLLARCLFIFGAIWGLVGLFLAIYQVINDWARAAGDLPAYVILLPLLLLSLYVSTHAIIQRARDIAGLPADGNIATRAVAVLLRLVGEVGAVGLLQRCLMAGIAAWAGATRKAGFILAYLQQVGIAYNPENAFVIGLIAIVYAFVSALLWLVAAYFLSEWVSQRVSATTGIQSIAVRR